MFEMIEVEENELMVEGGFKLRGGNIRDFVEGGWGAEKTPPLHD